MKNFEDTPQLLSYIAWNLKRLADEFERYNDREDERMQKTSTEPGKIRANADSRKLRDFLNNIDKDKSDG